MDDRDGKYKKLTPELYGAIIDEAHKQQLRVAAHIFSLADAKGLLKAGVDAFAHSVRDTDVDDELMALVKAKPNFVLIPNLPDRGVGRPSWPGSPTPVPAEELKKSGGRQRGAAPGGATGVRHPGPQPEADERRGRNRGARHGRLLAVNQHVEIEDMAASGMSPAQVLVAATKNAAAFLKLADSGTIEKGASGPISSCSTPTRSTTSATRGRSRASTCDGAAGQALAKCNGVWHRNAAHFDADFCA